MRSTVIVMSSPIFIDSPERLVRINIGVHSPRFFATLGPNGHGIALSRQCPDGPEYATSFGRTTHDLWAACVEPVQVGLTSNLPVSRSDRPQAATSPN